MTGLQGDKPLHIVIIGTGYVGLVGGTCFSALGHYVTCVDTNLAKIEALQKGIIPIFEPELDDLIAKSVAAGHLSFTTDLGKALSNAQVAFVAVGTPTEPKTGRADLTYIIQAAMDIASHAKNPLVLVHKSTVPVGTASQVQALLDKAFPNHPITIVSNPEFLREGQAIADFMKPDRIVLGSEDQEATKLMQRLYKPLTDQNIPLIITNRKSAEMIKYAANAFLAVKIAYINEISDLCEVAGADIDAIAKGIGMDKRISPHFLKVSPGYGGSCFPKDTDEMAGFAKSLNSPSHIIEAAIQANAMRKEKLIQRIAAGLPKDYNFKGAKVALLGLAFKGNTDDIRESPSLKLIPHLLAKGVKLHLHDPEALDQGKRLMPQDQVAQINFEDDIEATLKGADFAIIMTEWIQYSHLPPQLFLAHLRLKTLFDFRNLFEPSLMKSAGLKYISLGRTEY